MMQIPRSHTPCPGLTRAGFAACTDFSTRAGFTRSDSLVRVIRLARVGFFTRLDFFERIAVLLTSIGLSAFGKGSSEQSEYPADERP
jgi:hypothetical protein